MNTMNLPFAGYRYYSNFKVNGRGDYGLYWSSTPGDNGSARLMSFRAGLINWQDGSNRSHGCSVRCVKNAPLEITYDPNG